MNIKKIREKIAENLVIKVVCVVIAVFIFFFHELSSLEKKTVAVPLDIVSLGKTQVYSGIEDNPYVRITLRGRKDDIATISENDLHAYIDTSAVFQSGMYQFPVFVRKDVRIARFETLEITVEPEIVEVYLDEVASKQVEVKPAVSGIPAHGYESVGSDISPRHVVATGPSKLIDQIDSLDVEVLDITDATRDVVKQMKVVVGNRKISLDNPVVEVTARIRPKGLSKTFNQVQVEFTNLREDLVLENSYAAVDVIVEGEALVLERLTSASIYLSADCSSFENPGNYQVPVSASFPKGVRLLSISSDSLHVDVKVKTEETETGEAEENEGDDPAEEAEADLSAAEEAPAPSENE